MRRRTVLATALLATAAMGTVPSHAAPTKKPITGSYSVTLMPDPSNDVTNAAGKDGCTGASPQGRNSHPFTVPGAGTLKVVLDSPDPTGKGVTDWDLYVLDSDGTIVDKGDGATSHEETLDKLKKKTSLTFVVCNGAGSPNATITYTFTPA